jgi:hypothetical protein
VAYPPPYSISFIAQRITSGASIVDYTVPAGKVAVINSVSFVQDASTAVTTMAASIDLTGSGVFAIYYSQHFTTTTPINARLASYWQGRVVVHAGGKIRAQTLGTTNGYAVVSGYLLQD